MMTFAMLVTDIRLQLDAVTLSAAGLRRSWSTFTNAAAAELLISSIYDHSARGRVCMPR